MESIKLNKGDLNYRRPNIIELFEMRSFSGWGKSDNGYQVIAKAIDYSKKLCDDENEYTKAINDLKNQDVLSKWAVSLLKSEIEEKEKK